MSFFSSSSLSPAAPPPSLHFCSPCLSLSLPFHPPLRSPYLLLFPSHLLSPSPLSSLPPIPALFPLSLLDKRYIRNTSFFQLFFGRGHLSLQRSLPFPSPLPTTDAYVRYNVLLFFSRVNFLCLLLFGVRSTPVLPQ